MALVCKGCDCGLYLLPEYREEAGFSLVSSGAVCLTTAAIASASVSGLYLLPTDLLDKGRLGEFGSYLDGLDGSLEDIALVGTVGYEGAVTFPPAKPP